ncbi:MAG: hypothetical protein EXR69_14870 [Myxococcales bacterium]|nr:hypothetical protein [Myxococcales bacterium]
MRLCCFALPSTALLLLSGCGSGLSSKISDGSQDTGFVDNTDAVPPVIVHAAVEDAQPLGVDVPITATVTDDESGMFQVKLYYKNETAGSGDWDSLVMAPSDGGVFNSVIPGEDETSGGMHYYILALDNAQNEADSPAKGAEDPWHFRIYE